MASDSCFLLLHSVVRDGPGAKDSCCGAEAGCCVAGCCGAEDGAKDGTEGGCSGAEDGCCVADNGAEDGAEGGCCGAKDGVNNGCCGAEGRVAAFFLIFTNRPVRSSGSSKECPSAGG